MVGLIKGQTFQKTSNNEYVPRGKAKLIKTQTSDGTSVQKYQHEDTGEELFETYDKMSKSKFNGLNPEEAIDEFGWSQIRSLILLKSKPDAAFDWGDTNQELKGIGRWCNRLWHLVSRRREALGMPSVVVNENETNVYKDKIGKTIYQQPVTEKPDNFEKHKKNLKKIINGRKNAVKRCDKVITDECGEWAKYCVTLISFTDVLAKTSAQAEIAAYGEC